MFREGKVTKVVMKVLNYFYKCLCFKQVLSLILNQQFIIKNNS